MLGIARIAVLAAAMTLSAAWAQPEPSRIHGDESVVFFPTFGVRKDGAWRVDVHGWIYEPEEDSAWRNAAIETFGRALGLNENEISSPRFIERARRFIADNERGKRIGALVAGAVHVMPPSEPNGQFRGEILLPETTTDDAVVAVSAVNTAPGADLFPGAVFLLEPEGLTVVCDIDDTIKVSDVSDTRKLLRRTFVEPYEPVPGMAGVCGRLSAGGASLHYLSASPWQLYRPLADFLRDSGFPAGPMTLRSVRLRDETGAEFFRDPGPFKRDALREIMTALPERRFVLIGDTSEDDAEVFGEAALREPDRVVFVAIRAVPGDETGVQHARDVLAPLAANRWVVFTDPCEIPIEQILAGATPPSLDESDR